MSVVDKYEQRVELAGPIEITAEVRDRFWDMTIVKLTDKRISPRSIGLLFQMSRQTVERRLKEIPASVREHYRTSSALEALVGSGSPGAPA